MNKYSSCDHISCSTIVTRWYHHLDAKDYEGVARLVAPDAVWFRAGKPVTGQEDILAALQTRDPNGKVAHVLTNVVVDLKSDTQATVTSYVQVFKPDPNAPAAQRKPLPVMTNFLLNKDEMRKVNGEWKITLKKSSPALA